METGLLLVAATGLLWGALGIVMSLRADRNESPLRFLQLAYVFAALGAWAFVVDWPALWERPQERLFAMAGWAVAAGTLSALHVLALQAALRRGPHSVTWACVQSAMTGSFLASVLLWNERVAWPAWLGVGLVATALALLGAPTRETIAGAKPGWRFWVAATWLGIAAQQHCSSVVSHWTGWQDVGRMRPALAMSATLVVLTLATGVRREARPQAWPWRGALAFAACATLSFSLLYPALDQMAARGAAALVFPLAVGVSIATVSLWRIGAKGERPPARTLVPLALLVGGLLLLAYR